MALDDTTAAPAAEQSSTSATDGPPLRLREAADLLGKRREQEAKAAPAPAEDKSTTERARGANGQFAPTATESGTVPVPDAAPTEASGETTEAAPAEVPSIEPPKSWDKAEREWFATLPPERQQSIADREGKRDADYTRRVSEQARATQAAEAVRQKTEQLQQYYAQVIPALLQSIQNDPAAAEFADIKTPEDETKLANDDPFRWNRYAAHKMNQERNRATAQLHSQQLAQLQEAQFQEWSAQQDKAFVEVAKDFSDPEKAPKLREGIVAHLVEARGIPRETLPGLWKNPLFRDARMQQIVYGDFRWQQAQTAAKAAVAKAPPAAQRPGVAPAKGAANDAVIQQLEAKLDNQKLTTRQQIATAAALRAAKRAGGK